MTFPPKHPVRDLLSSTMLLFVIYFSSFVYIKRHCKQNRHTAENNSTCLLFWQQPSSCCLCPSTMLNRPHPSPPTPPQPPRPLLCPTERPRFQPQPQPWAPPPTSGTAISALWEASTWTQSPWVWSTRGRPRTATTSAARAPAAGPSPTTQPMTSVSCFRPWSGLVNAVRIVCPPG